MSPSQVHWYLCLDIALVRCLCQIGYKFGQTDRCRWRQVERFSNGFGFVVNKQQALYDITHVDEFLCMWLTILIVGQ